MTVSRRAPAACSERDAGAAGGRPGGGDTAAQAREGLSLVGRLGLAGRTGFYAILTAIVVRIALLGGGSGPQADAHGALAVVSRPLIGKVAIGAVALGFVLFGIGRLVGAAKDHSVSGARRAMTVLQGLFYLALADVPCSYLAGNTATGSQQQQQQTTARLLGLPGGKVALIAVGVILIAVCAQQIRGALAQDFRDGLAIESSPAVVRRLASWSGRVGISARALVFLPVGIFLIVSALQGNPNHSYGTDGELLKLSGHRWGIAVLCAVAAGLAVFVVYSAIETRYRDVVSAR